MANLSKSGKPINRYYQVDCLNLRGYNLGRIFIKADNVAQIRKYLPTAVDIYQKKHKGQYLYGRIKGNMYDGIAAKFKISCVCHLYAKACACGGYDLASKRTRSELRNITDDLARLLYYNILPLPQYYINSAS